MWKSTLLLLVLGGADHPQVYRWEAADGTLVFSDRPRGRAAEPRSVPPVNLLAGAEAPSLPSAATPRANLPVARAAVRRGRTRVAPVPSEACTKLRAEVEGLWRQRRRGYQAGEGRNLRAQIRERQQALRESCGVWR